MSDQSELWAAVVVSYDAAGLIELTNTRDRSATTVDTTVGEDAALGVINLWPIYAQLAYDNSDSTHVEVAKRGTIAMLWERGGSASSIAKVEWDEVFSADGLMSRVRNTGPRGRMSPSTNGPDTSSRGRKLRGWSDSKSLAPGILPSSRTVTGDE